MPIGNAVLPISRQRSVFSLKRTHTTRWGMEPVTVRGNLRHVSIVTTSIYLHVEAAERAASSTDARTRGGEADLPPAGRVRGRSVRIGDAKLRALADFTRTMVVSRGNPSSDELTAFLAAGYTEKTVLEIILAVSVKTLSNYTNQRFHTEVDNNFLGCAWTPPSHS